MIKDGGTQRREWMSSGADTMVVAYTSYGMELRDQYWSPPPPEPLHLTPDITCWTDTSWQQFKFTNVTDHDIFVAVLNIETKPPEGAQLAHWLVKANDSRCWPRPPVARPTMGIIDNGKSAIYTSFPREKTCFYSGFGKISATDPNLANNRWQSVAGPTGATLQQISVGSANAIWGLDTAGFPWKWNGSAWEKKAGTVGTLSVAADGTVWATNPADSMRVLKQDVANNKWTWNIPAGMKQVAAINATTAYGLDNAGTLFKLNGTTWEKKLGTVAQISAGADGELWATNPPDSNRVLRWDGTQWTWDIPLGLTSVSVGSAQNIWGLDSAGKVYKWTGKTWLLKPGTLKTISAASDGTVWGVNAKGVPYKWLP
jgi:hypothetical protein